MAQIVANEGSGPQSEAKSYQQESARTANLSKQPQTLGTTLPRSGSRVRIPSPAPTFSTLLASRGDPTGRGNSSARLAAALEIRRRGEERDARLSLHRRLCGKARRLSQQRDRQMARGRQTTPR